MSQRVWLLMSLAVLFGAALSGCLADEDAPETGSDGDGDGTGGDGSGGDGTDGGAGGGTGGNGTGLGAAPIANFSFAADGEATVGTNITFNASASEDPDGTNLTYSWDFGDGATGEGVEAVHVFTAAGNYTVVLNVTDADGASAESDQTVVVVAGGPSEFSDTVSASIQVPHPLLLLTPTGSSLDDYKTRGAVEGTTFQVHEFADVPTDGTSLTFTLESAADYVQFVVFDKNGAELDKNDFPTGKAEVVIKDDFAQGGSYSVFVFSAVTANAAYDLTVTLA